MTLTRILPFCLASACAAGALAAEALPEQCRIWSCSPAVLVAAAPDRQPDVVQIGMQSVPVTAQTIIVPSADGEPYACIGYDAFGDPEVMCLLMRPEESRSAEEGQAAAAPVAQ